MALDLEALFELVPPYLARQAWYEQAIANDEDAPVELLSARVLREGPPGLGRLLLARGDLRLQLLVGWRRTSELGAGLRNEDRALLGSASLDGETVVVYDAISDDELMCDLLEEASGGQAHGRLVRPLLTLVSHASLVFDERIFMKCYRVLERGPRAEVEVLFRLDEVGFNAMLAPIGRIREGEFDLVLVREFLASALEARLLALTSLRDLLAHATPGEEPGGEFSAISGDDPDRAAATAGGDFASEMHRLGETTARLHLALAEAFGTAPLQAARVIEELDGADPLVLGVDLRGSLGEVAEGALGDAIQLHGDFHLRRVMRAETGWLVAGFGDDPLYAPSADGPSLVLRRGSALEDLADMVFALERIAMEALAQRPETESAPAASLAAAWTRRNREAFLRGYRETGGIEALLPRDAALGEELLGAFCRLRERRYEATSSA